MNKTMDVREKLAELQKESVKNCDPGTSCLTCTYRTQADCMERITADFMIAHGVTVQEWVPVTERLPEDVYGKDREQIVVLVCTKSGKVSQCARMAGYEYSTDETLTKVEWIKNGKFYWSKNKAVTHWMPLPQPPKGE